MKAFDELVKIAKDWDAADDWWEKHIGTAVATMQIENEILKHHHEPQRVIEEIYDKCKSKMIKALPFECSEHPHIHSQLKEYRAVLRYLKN